MTCQSAGLGLRRLQMRKGAPCIKFAHCQVDWIWTVRKPIMKPDDCLKINWTIYFHICRFSKLPIFNLGASCFCSDWLARANLRNGPSLLLQIWVQKACILDRRLWRQARLNFDLSCSFYKCTNYNVLQNGSFRKSTFVQWGSNFKVHLS